MTSAVLASWLPVFLKFWLGGLAAIIGYRLLTGGIHLRGLLAEVAGGPISPERLAPLAASALAVGHWGSGVAGAPIGAESLPDMPVAIVGLLAASHAAYLGGKGFRRFKRRRGLP